jgi:glycerol-3-phosphate dehydrogenase (NAD(P)+)
MKKYQTAIVIGAGAFGTSMAFVLSKNFKRVILKVRSTDTYEALKLGENKIYLPGQFLPDCLIPAQNWKEVDELIDGKVELIVSGLPTSGISSLHADINQLSKYLVHQIPFVSLSKGIDPDSLELPDEMYETIFPHFKDQLMYLSGPSFAKEILDGQITLVSMAGRSRQKLLQTSEMLQTDFFKVFPTYDIKGVLLGGALKNILAISGGIIEGLGYNHNTRAAMITRGIVEMLRFGHVFNARPETFYGLSGMGDLILTSTGDLSRNKVFGREIALGKSAQEIIASSRSVVEGYKTTKAAYLLAEKYAIRTRLFKGMYKVLYENVPPKMIISEMMKLPSKFDSDSD